MGTNKYSTASHICFFFPLLSCRCDEILSSKLQVVMRYYPISSQVNNPNDQISASQKGKTLLPREGDGCQKLSASLSTQTTKGSETAEKKRGCSLHGLSEIGYMRCCGSYLAGCEWNNGSPNKIRGSWEICAKLLRMFWSLEKQLEGSI